MSKHDHEQPKIIEISSQGITRIVARTISDYDIRDENGQDLTDDLYIIRSSDLDQLAWTIAQRVHQATLQLIRDHRKEHES